MWSKLQGPGGLLQPEPEQLVAQALGLVQAKMPRVDLVQQARRELLLRRLGEDELFGPDALGPKPLSQVEPLPRVQPEAEAEVAVGLDDERLDLAEIDRLSPASLPGLHAVEVDGFVIHVADSENAPVIDGAQVEGR